MRVVECQSLAKVSRLSKYSWLLDTPCSNYPSLLFAKYQAPLYILGRVNCLQANVHFLFKLWQQNIHKIWTCFNCSAPNKNKVKFVWVSIINRTVPPLKKKREKNGKCIPKCWEFFGFWIWKFFFEIFRQKADSLKFG